MLQATLSKLPLKSFLASFIMSQIGGLVSSKQKEIVDHIFLKLSFPLSTDSSRLYFLIFFFFIYAKLNTAVMNYWATVYFTSKL